MNKKVPKIFVNKIDKINNNKEVFYSFKNLPDKNKKNMLKMAKNIKEI